MRLRVFAPRLLLMAAAIGALLGVLTGRLGPALFPLAYMGGMLLIVVVGAMPLVAWYGRRSTVTVTDHELIVQRVRRRALNRAEAGDVVVGFFTVAPLQFSDLQVCFTHRDGTRFTTLPLAYWDGDGLAQVAAALGVESRLQEPRDDHLRPFYVRHLWATAFGGAMIGLVLVIGAIVLYDAIAAHNRRADAARTLRTWNAEQAPRLRTLPGVRNVDADTDRTSVIVEYRGGEVPPGPARRAHDLACAGRDPSLRVELHYVDRSDPQQEAGRELRFTCEPATDPGFMLDGLAAHPLPGDVEFASFELSPLTDFEDRVTGTRLEAFTHPPVSPAEARATLCTLRAPRGELVLAGDLDRC
jgi:hypothetical protein